MFIDFWREGGREREKERERKRNINVREIDELPPLKAPTGDPTCSLGMCPDQESNLIPLVDGMIL